MRPEIFIATISLPFVTAIVVFAMKYAASFAAARAQVAEQGELKALVAAQAAQLAQVASSLQVIEREVAGQSRAIAGVESILRQVG